LKGEALQKIIRLALLLALFADVCSAASMPDPRLTPGLAATHNAAVVCAAGYPERARHVTDATKAAVYREYGKRPISYTDAQGKLHRICCEIDHLIPLELGGSNDVRNLWPQPWAEARKKDQVENYLRREVCSGRMSLRDAQRAIGKDWRSILPRAEVVDRSEDDIENAALSLCDCAQICARHKTCAVPLCNRGKEVTLARAH
jgi:hypothetical protein